MLKIAIASLFLGASLLGFSDETDPSTEEVSSEDLAVYEQIGMGNAHVLYQNYSTALEHFDNADLLNSSSSQFLPEIQIMTSFGKAIAYDNLEMDDQCKQALGSFLLACYADKDNEEPILFDEEKAYFLEVMQIMKDMASLARSPDIRNMLIEIITDIMEEE